MSVFAEAALRYARMGLRVIPLQTRGKIPIFKNWPEVATSDAELITRWWAQAPASNVGIATGHQSGVFVLDVDVKSGGMDEYERLVLKHGRFPETWQQITGSKGMHLFFRYPAFEVRNAAGILPGIDIRGEGGQVVAPPSIHPDTGLEYAWDGLADIEHTALAEAPAWLLDLLQHRDADHHQSKFLPVTEEKIQKGVRHPTLLALAGMMRRLGLDEPEILPALSAFNARRCDPPKPEAELIQMAKSITRYRPADGSLARIAAKLWKLTKAKEIEHQQREAKLGVKTVDGLTVYRSHTVDTKCVIGGLLYNGLTVFAGRPKSGKSFLALQAAISVAEGSPLFGSLPINMPGGVLYFALEESQTRTGSRMRQLTAEAISLQNISMVYDLAPLMVDGRAQLDKLLSEKRPTLTIIDTFLAAVRGGKSDRGNVMRAEYEEIDTLHKLAEKHETAMVLVHHTRKGVIGESGIDSVAGSTGITAASDSVWTLKRDGDTSIFEVVSRECEQQEFALRFRSTDPMGWELMGTGKQVLEARAEKDILALMHEEGTVSIGKIVRGVGIPEHKLRPVLRAMMDSGSIHRSGRTDTYYLNIVKDYHGQAD